MPHPLLRSHFSRPLRRLLLAQALSLVFFTSLAGAPASVAQSGLEQTVSIVAQAETIKSLLDRIEKQVPVHFMYSRQLIGANRRVSVVAEQKPLSVVLDQVLVPRGILYELVDDRIVLTPSPTKVQEGSVSGQVLDANGAPLPGVTVLVEGTTSGTATDSDGRFTIAGVSPGAHVLLFSYVGFATQRQLITVTDGQDLALAVNLNESTSLLNEAVVVGYGTTRRQDVTGAVATVSSRDFVQGQVTDPQRLIQGKVAGVQVTAGGGAPGEVGVIRIRGGSSLNASNDPLVVIDGVPVDNNGIAGAGSPLALINPNDIETFTILKDASATAIYGSRASNGVIIITTKKGLAGDKTHVTFSSQVSRSTNYGKIDVLSGDEYRALTDQLIAAGLIPADRRDLLGSAKHRLAERNLPHRLDHRQQHRHFGELRQKPAVPPGPGLPQPAGHAENRRYEAEHRLFGPDPAAVRRPPQD